MGKELEEIITAGFGGQGVLFLAKIIAQVGMITGRNVSWMPSYGPEMRGGTANCSVVVSNEEIASPMVLEPDLLLVMNKPSVAKFEPKIKPGGTMIYNTSLIDIKKFRDDITVNGVPANEIAAELGNPKVANIVMAGAYAKASKVLNFDDIINAFPKIIPARKKDLLEINIEAFKKGYEYGSLS